MHELCSAPVGVAHVSYHEKNAPNTIGLVELAAHTVVVPPTLSGCPSPYTLRMAMLTPLSIVLSLFCLFLVRLLLGLRRVSRDIGSVHLRPLNCRLINL